MRDLSPWRHCDVTRHPIYSEITRTEPHTGCLAVTTAKAQRAGTSLLPLDSSSLSPCTRGPRHIRNRVAVRSNK